MKDLLYFLIIILVFILAFAISIESILSPYDHFTTKVFTDFLDIAYWPIYGELDLLEGLYACLNPTDKPCEFKSNIAVYASVILLMVYMVMVSVLLLNLLIAMFR